MRELYLSMFSDKNVSNYFHLLFAGHITEMLLYHGNLAIFSNQGWEHLNNLMKMAIDRMSQRSGSAGNSMGNADNRSFELGSSKAFNERGNAIQSRLVPVVTTSQKRFHSLSKFIYSYSARRLLYFLDGSEFQKNGWLHGLIKARIKAQMVAKEEAKRASRLAMRRYMMGSDVTSVVVVRDEPVCAESDMVMLDEMHWAGDGLINYVSGSH